MDIIRRITPKQNLTGFRQMTLKSGTVRTDGRVKLTRLRPSVLKCMDREDVFPSVVTRSRHLALGDDGFPVRVRRPNRRSTGLWKTTTLD
jgi:hypothetical protein